MEVVTGAIAGVRARGSAKSKGRGIGKNKRHWQGQKQEQGHGAADSPYNGQRDPRLWGTPGLH